MRKIFPFFLVSLAFIFGANIIHNIPGIWFLALSFFLVPFFFLKYELGIKIAFLSVFFLNWLSDVIKIIPRQITWIYDLLVLAWFLIVLLMWAKQPELRKKSTVIDIFLIVLFLLGIFSYIVNNVSIGVCIAGIRKYFKFVMFFYVLYYFNLKENFFKSTFKLLFIVALIQVPVALFQRFMYPVRTGDVVGGTLGFSTSGILTQFLLFITAIVLSLYREHVWNFKKMGIFLLLLIIPMSINETKIFFWLFPLLVFFLFRRELVQFRVKLLPIAVTSLLLFSLAYKIYHHYYTYFPGFGPFSAPNIRRNLDPRYAKAQGKIWRIGAVTFAFKQISTHWTTLLAGVGPANTSYSFIEEWSGKYYYPYVDIYRPNFLSYFIWEYGIMGVLLFFLILYKLRATAKKIQALGTPYERAVAHGYEGILLIICLSIFYNYGLFNDTLGYTFWFMSAFIQRTYDNIVKREREQRMPNRITTLI